MVGKDSKEHAFSAHASSNLKFCFKHTVEKPVSLLIQ